MSQKTPGKRGPGRPKNLEKTQILPLRIPESLWSAVDLRAIMCGVSRNQAGTRLIEAGLNFSAVGSDSCGYNPQTGDYRNE